MQMKESIIRLKNKTNLSDRWQKLYEWPNQQFSTFLKRENTLASSARPKDLEDH